MDSVITIKNDMKYTRDGDNGRWEQGITITSEDRDVILLGYNKGPEVFTFAFFFHHYYVDQQLIINTGQ